MRKIGMAVGILAFVLAPLAAQTITVTSPNGGETLTKGGGPYPIAWRATGVTQNVKIVLLQENGERFGLIAEGLAASSSPYSWTVGETRSGEAPAGNYLVRVVSDDGAVKDASDRAFTLRDEGAPPAPPTITITSPRDGDSWEEGTTHNITWEPTGAAGEASFHLVEGGRIIFICRRDLASGSCPWPVDNMSNDAGNENDARDYRIRMTYGNPPRFAPSGAFHITHPPAAGSGGHDFVISDPFLEQRSSGRGFRVRITDRTGDFHGKVVLSYFCMKMGLGNAMRDERVLNLTRGVPQTVNLSNLRGTLFDNECGMDFVLQVNPDHALAESDYGNNRVTGTFYWNRRDGRVAQVRLGRNFKPAGNSRDVVIERGDVERVEGGRVTLRLEIMVRNCGREAFENAVLRVFHGGRNWTVISDDTALDIVRNIDLPAGHMRILNRTLTFERDSAENHLYIRLANGEDDAAANNNFNCSLYFSGF